MEAGSRSEGIEEMSVYRACEQVQDGRAKRGVRSRVALILTLIVLASMTTSAAIAEWVRHRGPWLKQVFPCSRQSFPCAATYSNVLQK